MKKISICGLIFVLILVSSTMAFASTVEESYDQDSSEQYIIEKYDEFFEQNNRNNDAALKDLIASSDSLELVAYSEQSYKDGVPVMARSNMADIKLTDSIIHDSDWGTYVYIGTWDWMRSPDEANLSPWDVVGIYTQNSNDIRAKESIVYGYGLTGRRTVYYNTDTGETSGDIQKGTDVLAGTVYWLDEKYVDNGRIVVPLYYKNGSTSKMITCYGHAWTTSNITGVGGSVSISSLGFNVSWEDKVSHGDNLATSPGARIPSI